MSDIAKWAILVAGFITIMSLFLVLPIVDALNPSAVTSSIGGVLSVAGSHLKNARGFLNNFLTPVGIGGLNVALLWVVGKKFITWLIRITVGAYRFIFK